MDMIEELIHAGADINWKSKKNGCTVMHYMAKQTNKKRLGSLSKYRKLLHLLIYKKANLVEKDENGDTPIHCASMVGNLMALKIMLPFCADVNLKNK